MTQNFLTMTWCSLLISSLQASENQTQESLSLPSKSPRLDSDRNLSGSCSVWSNTTSIRDNLPYNTTGRQPHNSASLYILELSSEDFWKKEPWQTQKLQLTMSICINEESFIENTDSFSFLPITDRLNPLSPSSPKKFISQINRSCADNPPKTEGESFNIFKEPLSLEERGSLRQFPLPKLLKQKIIPPKKSCFWSFTE